MIMVDVASWQAWLFRDQWDGERFPPA